MADRIKGITVEINGDTTGLSKALSGVNKEIKNTQSQLKDVNRLLKLDPGNADLLTQKQKLLAQAVEETKNKLETLKTAQKQADEALKNGTITQEQYDGLQREIEETTQKLKDLEKQAEQSATAVQKIAAAGEKLKDIGGKVSGVGKDLSMYVTAPLVAAGTAGVKTFAEVDKTMALANKTMNNTAEEAEHLGSAMKSAASNSTFSMDDAANASLNFARAGLDAEQAAAALAPAMNLAAGEGGNLDTVSSGLVATINGFHGSFEDAGKYADVFASACNNSALDVDSLSSAMSVAAPIFASAGYKVNDAALYMGIMANNGIEADKAANSLKTGIARLVSPAKEGATMMEQLGISVTNTDGSMKDSVQIQKELHEAFANLSESEQIAAASAIFGKNQMAPWLALINTAPEDVDELNESLRTCAGTTDEMAQTMMGGFGGSIEKLKSSINVLAYSLGEALAPTIQRVVNFLQDMTDKFNALSPAQQQVIVKTGLAAAALGPLLLITGKMMTAVGTIMTVIPKLAGALSTVKGAFAALNAVMLANPIAIVIAAIAALVAAFIYLWNTNESFRQFWIKLWENIKQAAVNAANAVKTGVTAAWNAVKSVTGTIFTAVGGVVEKIWGGITGTVSKAVEGIKSTISTGLNAAKSTVEKVLGAIKTAFSTVWEGAKSIVSGAIEKIKGMMNFHWELPKLKLPHFSMSGKFSLDPPSVPHISVDWYRKAMNNGMILDSPTIFGSAGGKLLGGGEAGAEAVVGVNSLRNMIEEAVAGQTSAIVAAMGASSGDIVIPVYVGNTLLDELVVNAQNRQNLRSGGR